MDCTDGNRVHRFGRSVVDGYPALECAKRIALGSGVVNGALGELGMSAFFQHVVAATPRHDRLIILAAVAGSTLLLLMAVAAQLMGS
jgi:hypothetical protein